MRVLNQFSQDEALTTLDTRTNLDAITAVDMWHALIVLPDDAKLDETLGDLDNVKCALILRVRLQERLECRSEFGQRLHAERKTLSKRVSQFRDRHALLPVRQTCSNSGSEGRTISMFVVEAVEDGRYWRDNLFAASAFYP